MVAESDEVKLLKRLISEHDTEKPKLIELDYYYEGQQPLSYMHPDLQRELNDRIRQVVINWPRLVVDSIEERLDVEGFRYPGADAADEELWRIWQVNNLDEWSQQGHVEAMVMRRAYGVVSSNDEDAQTPIVSVESPLEMHVELNPATRTIRNGIKRWQDPEKMTKGGVAIDLATLYTAQDRIYFEKDGGRWTEFDRHDHGLGRPPIGILANRPRLRRPLGTSDLVDVIPLSDAACKIATDMMVGAEFHAIGRNWVFGMSQDDFKDPKTGQQLSTWEAVLGRVWSSTNKDAKAGSFPASDLSNFHNTIESLARLVCSIAGLPAHELGFTTDNPASADAIRSGEIRKIKRAERKQRGFGGGWEDIMRLARRIQTGDWDPDAARLETIWRDPATPTVAQKSDAAVKLRVARIVPLRQTREDLGYSQTRIALMEDEDAKEAALFEFGPKPDPTLPDGQPVPA